MLKNIIFTKTTAMNQQSVTPDNISVHIGIAFSSECLIECLVINYIKPL